MYKHPGKTIMDLTEVLSWIGIIGSVIAGVVLIFGGLPAVGIPLLIGGPLLFWVGGLGMYAFGQMADDLSYLRDRLEGSAEGRGRTEAQENAPVRTAAASPVKPTAARPAQVPAPRFTGPAGPQAQMPRAAAAGHAPADTEGTAAGYEPLPDPETAEGWYRRGEELLAGQLFDEAAFAFEQADGYRDAMTRWQETFCAKARACMDRGDFTGAAEAIEGVRNCRQARRMIEDSRELRVALSGMDRRI